MTGEFSQNLLAEKLSKAFPKLAELIGTIPSGRKLDEEIPGRPPVMCAGCPHRDYSIHCQRINVPCLAISAAIHLVQLRRYLPLI